MAKTFTAEEVVEDLRFRSTRMTQTRLAAEIGVPDSRISEILRGRQVLTDRVAEALGYEKLPARYRLKAGEPAEG